MAITLNPYKLTLKEMEALLQGPVSMLPGQLVRFEGDEPAYGEVTGVRSMQNEGENGCIVRIELLHGTPAMAPQSVTLLTDAEMAREVQRMQEPFENPMRLGESFTAEFERLGPLTVLESDDFTLKYDALLMLIDAIEPYQRLLIIDPLGIFSASDGLKYLRAGEDVRLSLQQVGSKRFLDAFGETFPDNLRELALRVLADRWPVDVSGFVSFSRLLDLVSSTDMPLKNLILQSLHTASGAQIFADTAEQVFNFSAITAEPMIAVDLSVLAEPWKSLFYEEMCREFYRNAGSDIVPVLIYPESYLADVESWVQKADEAEVNLVVVASPYLSDSLRRLSNNLISVESRERLHLSGELTMGLPVSFPLEEVEASNAPIKSSAEPESRSIARDSTAEQEQARPQEAEDGPEQISQQDLDALLDNLTPQMVSEEFGSHGEEAHRAQSHAGPIPADMPLPEGEPEPDLTPLSPDELAALIGSLPPPPDSIPDEESCPLDFPEPSATNGNLDSHQPEPVETVEAQLDYPDADEGALPEPPAAEAAASQELDFANVLNESLDNSAPGMPETADETETEEAMPAMSDLLGDKAGDETDLFGGDDFSFDVNLDQKMPDAWDSDWTAPQESGMPIPAGAVPIQPTGITEEKLAQMFSEIEQAGDDGGAGPVDLLQGRPVMDQEAPVRTEAAAQPEPEDEMVPIIPKIEDDMLTMAEYKPGDRVRHDTYGLGIVNKVVPMEKDIILNITFESVGKRLLDPSRCKLTRESA